MLRSVPAKCCRELLGDLLAQRFRCDDRDVGAMPENLHHQFPATSVRHPQFVAAIFEIASGFFGMPYLIGHPPRALGRE